MKQTLTKLDCLIIALFTLGALLAITSLFLPPTGTISASVVSVFAMLCVLIAVVLAIQSGYTLDIHIGEHRYMSWHPDNTNTDSAAAEP